MATQAKTKSISNAQIGQIADRLSTQLRKSGLPFDGVQKALMVRDGLAIAAMVAAFRQHVEANSDLITRTATVDPSRSPEQAITATGRAQYVNGDVVKTMPRGDGGETEVVFFKLGRNTTCAEVEEAFELRGLKPDPIALAKVNEDDPAFADEHPNATQWKDANGRYCYAAFDRWGGGRDVRVDRDGRDWSDDWWFAGVRN